MTVIGLTGASFYSRFFTQNAASNTADTIVQLSRKAQFYAMTGNKSNASGWGINYVGNVITLYQGPAFSLRNQIWDENYTVENAVTVSGLTEINFARLTGLPTTTATIEVSGNQGSTQTLTVNAQGTISR